MTGRHRSRDDGDAPLAPLAPLPDIVRGSAGWVAEHLDGLFRGEASGSPAFIGGQTAADGVMATLDIVGYARRRNQVWPPEDRGASKISPYIRHGLLPLPYVHDHPAVAGAPAGDRSKFRAELLWQEYSRHWYAVNGTATRQGIVHEPVGAPDADAWRLGPWPAEMNCIAQTVDELQRDGYVVNQARMWLASQWTIRAGAHWRDGDDAMFRHLLDGSRAANRLGWQWVTGGTRSKTYGFARSQVMNRAPEFCGSCALNDRCPIGSYPSDPIGPKIGTARTGDPVAWFGPAEPVPASEAPSAVWLTAESLGDDDPALAAHPGLDVHFVFDEPLLRRLELDGKRLVFLTECLADLARRRTVTAWRGAPNRLIDELGTAAVTFAPVPGSARIRSRSHGCLEVHPWPWLRPRTERYLDRLLGPAAFPSFSAFSRLTEPTHD